MSKPYYGKKDDVDTVLAVWGCLYFVMFLLWTAMLFLGVVWLWGEVF